MNPLRTLREFVFAVYFTFYYAVATLAYAMRINAFKRRYEIARATHDLDTSLWSLDDSITSLDARFGEIERNEDELLRERDRHVRELQFIIKHSDHKFDRDTLLRDDMCRQPVSEIKRVSFDLKPIQRRMKLFRQILENLQFKAAKLREVRDNYAIMDELFLLTSSLEYIEVIKLDLINGEMMTALGTLVHQFQQTETMDVEQQQMIDTSTEMMPSFELDADVLRLILGDDASSQAPPKSSETMRVRTTTKNAELA